MSGYREARDLHASATVLPTTSRPSLGTPNPAFSSNRHAGPPQTETQVKVEEQTPGEPDDFISALSHPQFANQVGLANVVVSDQNQEVDDYLKALSHPESADQAGRANGDRTQFTRAIASRTELVTLRKLNVDSTSESKILYYFGVLATAELLLPRFHFTKGRKDRYWGVKMTMYGMTFVRSHVYESRRSAKVSICREALKKLKVEFPNWVVPERPRDLLAPSGWDWVEILQGYRHEVEVDGGAYFGPLRYYAAELQSKQGAAHVALYEVLVRQDYKRVETEGAPSLKRPNEPLLAVVPRDTYRKSAHGMVSEVLADLKRPRDTLSDVSTQDSLHTSSGSRAPARRRLDNYTDSRKTRRRGGRNRSPATTSQQKPVSGNANLQPLKNCRLAAVEATVVKEERRWKLTPSEISRELHGMETWDVKLENCMTLPSMGRVVSSMLEEICSLLTLERPEMRIERTDGRLIETDGQYTAAAYFNSDPFLARAGAIGKIQTFSGNRAAASCACAQRVCEYLIDLVKEDMMLEDNAAKEREAISRWGETAGK
ncbi:uncharacterized protein DSM5745_10753 [Aspergillus mulundensis]|uniref:Uncharacterized protein n=1 Tax=Aspergillus mulundensis TaxID=1810919 RepID=A0A3D8QHH5_9EURO|nr:hypothetical protein DSM5745_10753 [Aspergillus mulundensis]RDW61255.1 hypothetical protein DSM5745_10753 [Aspergillus mulundensis]